MPEFDWNDLPAGRIQVQRNGATWEGKIVGYVAEPAIVLELESGQRFPIVVRGATYERPVTPLRPDLREVPVDER